MKVGDSVETIDDAIQGTITLIVDDIITIEDADGFEFQFHKSELIKVENDLNLSSFSATTAAAIQKEKSGDKKRQIQKPKSKKRHQPSLVIDLHIHQLTDSTKCMTNFDMLNLQLDAARRQLEFAIKKRIPKLVFIHGVGEGVLRQELETVLRRYNNVTFYDADYREYGLGATEVKIFQNVKP